MSLHPIPSGMGDPHRRVVLPRCPHCGGRPEARISQHDALAVPLDGAPGSPTIVVPAYEVLPCCTASYVVTVEHVTRKQRIQAARRAR